ncbi:MAG: tRNA preQ1(34) S-adenosylmethionine ribosyltransferase-isomerase QueA [bacterium]
MDHRESLFDFRVPSSLIAQRPLPQRDRAALMLLSRNREGISHSRFHRLPELLAPGTLLVLNDTRVVPARLEGHLPGGRPLEALLTDDVGAGQWRALIKGARRVKPGDRIRFADGAIVAEALHRDEEGAWIVRFDDPEKLHERLEAHGLAPLPPYIRRDNGQSALEHRRLYQTCYARREGSIAAPTAGFHFTPDVFEALRAKHLAWVELTLHVGEGTFLPIQERDPAKHRMHEEAYSISPEACRAVLAARRGGRPVVAVGTTTVRALESWARLGFPEGIEARTDIFIRPPFEFLAVDGMITNFHQPASTLLQLVAAFHGEARILAAYRTAAEKGYRFYSYGDCMAILPAPDNPQERSWSESS